MVASLIAGRDIEWEAFLHNAAPAPCLPLDSNDFLYVLYTSGTTGDPKGCVPCAMHVAVLGRLSDIVGLPDSSSGFYL